MTSVKIGHSRRLVFCVAISAIVVVVPPIRAQSSSTTNWEKAAGGKASFEVASVKLNKTGTQVRPTSNFPLNAGDEYSSNGGLLSATNTALIIYIGFAYKLNAGQTIALMSKLPNWAKQERFDVQARADGKATKDQMRLMMRSLLADRFKLAMSMETQEEPVYELVLENPGKLGSQLIDRSSAVPCSGTSPVIPPESVPAALAKDISTISVPCGEVDGLSPDWMPGTLCWIGRDFTAEQLASSLTSPVTGLNRSVVDQTGISGRFDFILYWARQVSVNAQSDLSAPPFTDALKNQLGLKLVSAMGEVNVFVIDHIEEPSPN